MTFFHQGVPTECPARHDPNSHVWYSFVWDHWLPAGVEIGSSAWAVDARLTVEDTATDVVLSIMDRGVSITYQHVNRIKLSGGTSGETYLVTNRVITAEPDAQTADKSIILVCKDQ